MQARLTLLLSAFLVMTSSSVVAHEPQDTHTHKHHSNRISKACTVMAGASGALILACAIKCIHALRTLEPFESTYNVDVWGIRTLAFAAATTLWIVGRKYSKNKQEIHEPAEEQKR